jgi:tetratricopeptide (TPR) repeat protein
MVASVLFQPTSIDDELQLTTSKSLSLSSDDDDDDNHHDLVVFDEDYSIINAMNDYMDDNDDDDTTIHYDNTTTAHTQHQFNVRQRQRQQSALLEEQRILQTSPSSVVSSHVPGIVTSFTSSNIHAATITMVTNHPNFNHNHHNRRISTTATTVSSTDVTPFSIPTLNHRSCTHSSAAATVMTKSRTNVTGCTAATTATTTAIVPPKPFFIMDFLEDIDPTVLALVQQTLLQQRQPRKGMCHHTLLPSTSQQIPTRYQQRRISFSSTVDTLGTNRNSDKTSSNNDNDDDYNTAATTTSFLQRSIAMVQQYHHRGILAAQQGDWTRAVRYWLDALEIRNQIQPTTANDIHSNKNDSFFDFDVADTYHNIGIAYEKLQQYDTALHYIQQALEMRIDAVAATVDLDDDDTNTLSMKTTLQQQQQQLHMDIAVSLRTIGNIYQKQNQLSMAIQFYIKCKLLQEELLPTRTIMIDMARTCIAIGHSYAMGQAYSDAYEAYHDAITIFHQLGISTERNNIDYDNDQYYSEYQTTLSNLHLMEQRKS